MDTLINKKSISADLVNLFFALVGVLLYIYSIVPYGMGVTDDSVNYLAAAISAPYELTKVDGTPFVEWPPLFPLIISFYKLSDPNLLTFAAIVHGVSYFFTLLLAFSIISRSIVSVKISIISKIAILMSTPLLLVHVFIWSEALFILLLLLSIYFLEKFLAKESLFLFTMLLISSILMTFQRKSGVIIDLGIALSFICLTKGSIKKRTLLSLLFLVFSVLPFFIYLQTRFTSSGQFFTKTQPDIFRLKNNLIETLDIITSWFLPDEIDVTLRSILLGLFLLSFVLLIIKTNNQNVKLSFKASYTILLIVSSVYVLSIIIGFTYLSLGEPFDDRIFAPIYIPGILLFFKALDISYLKIDLLPIRYTWLLSKLLFWATLIWLIYPSARTFYHIKNWHNHGVGGYNSEFWRSNKTIEWLKRSNNYPIFTNFPFPIYYHLKIKDNQPIQLLQEEELKKYPYIYVCFTNCQQDKGNLIFESEDGKVILKRKE